MVNIEVIEEQIREIVNEQLCLEGDFSNEDSFADDLGADSLDQVELIMVIEEKFDISIPDEEAEKIVTVQDAINYVQNAISK